jgi:hypothetical protein
VPLAGPDVQYDHRTPLWLDEGAHKVENIFPICTTPCHRDKSANEAPIRAKVLRLIKAKAGVKKDKRPIPSRGFDRSMTKGFDGKVRPRSVRAKKPEDRPSDWVRDEPSNDVKAPITRRSAGGGGR